MIARRLAALALLAPTPALAQAYQCAPPGEVGPIAAPGPDGPARRVAIGGYTLAASWSPDYCKMADERTSMQCSGRNGRFGFVLHGLWPEARFGPPPQWCAGTPGVTPATIRANLCMTPSPRLIAHEWAKHGSCMARRPEEYFAAAARLWRGIAWPDADRLARKRDLTAGDVRAAFVEANRGWHADAIGLDVSGTGWLREIHLCYDRAMRPARCRATALGPADAAPLKVWRGL